MACGLDCGFGLVFVLSLEFHVGVLRIFSWVVVRVVFGCELSGWVFGVWVFCCFISLNVSCIAYRIASLREVWVFLVAVSNCSRKFLGTSSHIFDKS